MSTDLRVLMSAVLLLALCGCSGRGDENLSEDPKRTSERGLLRHQYFVECMKLLPAGPQATKYNDWDEVVESCSQTAWYQANQVMP